MSWKRTSLSMASFSQMVSSVHAEIKSHLVSNQEVTEPQPGTMYVDLSIQVSGPLF